MWWEGYEIIDLTLSDKFTFDEKVNAEIIINETLVKNVSTTKIIKELRKKGLTYNRSNMLLDIRKAKSDYHIYNDKEGIKQFKPLKGESKDRSNLWFKSVFEPLRKEYGLDSETAFEIIQQERETSHKLIREAKIGSDYQDRYEAIFNAEEEKEEEEIKISMKKPKKSKA